MLSRLGALLRLLSYFFEEVSWFLTTLATLVEEAGFDPDVETFFWLLILICVATQRWELLVTLLVGLAWTSPAWRVSAPASGVGEY